VRNCGLSVLEFIFIIGIHTPEPHEEKVMNPGMTLVIGDHWRLLGIGWQIYPNGGMRQSSREL
jgi:hypothetical protein